MKIFVTYFLVSIRARVFNFCVHLYIGKAYCVNEIKMLILILPSFLKFSIFLSVTPIKFIWTFFLSKISQQLLDLGF